MCHKRKKLQKGDWPDWPEDSAVSLGERESGTVDSKNRNAMSQKSLCGRKCAKRGIGNGRKSIDLNGPSNHWE
jgi:hypothetical protein